MLFTPDAILERRKQILKERLAGRIGNEEAGRRLIEIDPDSAVGWLALATAKFEAGDLDAADHDFWRALERAPSNPSCYFSLADLSQRRGDPAMAKRFQSLALRKVSHYDKIPEDIVQTLGKGLGEAGSEPALYDYMADRIEKELGDEPWPEKLLPYRLFDDVQQQTRPGVGPDVIDDIRDNAAACIPILYAALREAYDTPQATLSAEAEGLVMALLGELGGVELIEELLVAADGSSESVLHSQWAVMRLGQRFPEEAPARLRALAKGASADARAVVAQHLYFLREKRQAVMELLDGFPELGGDESAAHLLLTVSTVLALLGSTADSLGVIQRHQRQLSKKGRRWMDEAVDQEDGFVPVLIDLGLDELDVNAVCTDRALMRADEEEEEEEEDEADAPRAVKPGRNDPCWCGSGKKYKKCHLDQDEREEREGRAEDDVFTRAWSRLLDFSKQVHSRSDMERAAKMFFERSIEEIDDKKVMESGFVVWCMLDFRAREGGRTVLDEYLRRSGDRLDERTRALIESWREHRYGLWEIQRIEEGRGAEVRDIFSGEAYFADDVSTSRQCNRWDCMISRLHRFEGKWLFLADGLLVPRSLVPRLREEVERGARKSKTTPSEYFRSRSHEWARFVQEASDKQWADLKLVNFEGDPIEFSQAEYEVADADAAAGAIARAPMFEEQTDEEDGPGKRAFGWIGDGAERRSYGGIEIEAGMLRLECNSRRRLEVGKALIEEHCGSAVRHRKDSFTSVEDMKKAAREGPPEPQSKRLDPELEREIVLKYQAEHYAKWPDERLPALGGKTPRQAMRSKAGRAQVEELLRDFENSAERARKAGRPEFDFSILRKTLGL